MLIQPGCACSTEMNRSPVERPSANMFLHSFSQVCVVLCTSVWLAAAAAMDCQQKTHQATSVDCSQPEQLPQTHLHAFSSVHVVEQQTARRRTCNMPLLQTPHNQCCHSPVTNSAKINLEN